VTREKGNCLPDQRRERPGRYSPGRIHLLSVAVFGSVLVISWVRPIAASRGTPFDSLDFPLNNSQPNPTFRHSRHGRPRMSIFFPGNFFPLATLSSIADHMFSSLLPCFSLLLISEVRDPLILTLRFIQVVVDQIVSYTIFVWSMVVSCKHGNCGFP
jgi:hypothetical protein